MTFRNGTGQLKPMTTFAMSSFADIVLLLLIFFLLTSSFVTNFGIQVDIPRAETASVTEQNFINVAVTNDGRFYVMGDLVTRAGLSESIRSQHQRNPNATLVLRADKNAIIDDAVNVMNIAKALDISIIMATERATR